MSEHPAPSPKEYSYFVSFNYVNKEGHLRSYRMQIAYHHIIENMVMINDLENTLRESLFESRYMFDTTFAPPVLDGYPDSVVITNFILLKTL